MAEPKKRVPRKPKPVVKEESHQRMKRKAHSDIVVGSRQDAPADYVKFRVYGAYARLIKGTETLDEWDDEELAALRRKDKNGRFTGRPPKVLPMELARLFKAEVLRRADERVRQHVFKALDTLSGVLDDTEAKPSDRISAAKTILDRALGRIPEKVELSGGDRPIEHTISSAIHARPRISDDEVDPRDPESG